LEQKLILKILSIISISVIAISLLFYYNESLFPNNKIVTEPILLYGDNSLEVGRNKIVSGMGTNLNPFLIKDLIVSSETYGIVIKDVTKFVILENISIIGGSNGITIENSQNIFLDKLEIHNTTDTSIMLLGANNIIINNTKIMNPGKNGINVDQFFLPEKTFGNTITNSIINNSTDTSIILMGNNTKISNNDILNSKFRSIKILSPFANSLISDNYIENSYMEAILVIGYKNNGTVPEIGKNPASSSQILVTNNEIINMHEDGIEFQEGVTNSTISNNFIHDSPLAVSVNEGHMNSIELWIDCNYNRIVNNTIQNTGGIPELHANGIIIAESSFNIIEENSISNVPGWGVVILWDGNNWPISVGNIVQNNKVFDARPWNVINKQDSRDLATLNTIIFE